MQIIRTSADSDSISGYFIISFNGEITEPMAYNVLAADGEKSMESELRRLSTIGDVTVNRLLSKKSIQNIEFQLSKGSSIIRIAGSTNLMDDFSKGDIIFTSVGNARRNSLRD